MASEKKFKVLGRGLEPPRLAAQPPQDCASTISPSQLERANLACFKPKV